MKEYGLFSNLKARLVKRTRFPTVTLKAGETLRIGMSNEELIRQLYIKAPISEENARALFPVMELYCAQQPIALGNLVEQVQVQLRDGIPWTDIRRSLVGRAR